MSDLNDMDTVVSESTSEEEKDSLYTTGQLLSACLEEYPGIELKVTDYQKIYEEGGKSAPTPYINHVQDSDYQYYTIPTSTNGPAATLGIPIFAKGLFKKIQDRENPDVHYVIYPSRDCKSIEILRFPFNMLKPFLSNDLLRESIAKGVKADKTDDLKKRFEAIEKISKRFNS